MTIRIVVATAVVLLATSVAGQQEAATVQRVLLDRSVWGRDIAALLTQLPALRQAGETQVYVFPDRAAGAVAFVDQAAARAAIARAPALAARPATLRPQFQVLQAEVAGGAPLRVEAATLIDGDGVHLTVTRDALQLLAPNLTMQTVRERFGPPTRTTLLTIQNRGERKPVILTLHVYADGAIAFAESNYAEPGVVERVVLTLSSIAPAVAQ